MNPAIDSERERIVVRVLVPIVLGLEIRLGRQMTPDELSIFVDVILNPDAVLAAAHHPSPAVLAER